MNMQCFTFAWIFKLLAWTNVWQRITQVEKDFASETPSLRAALEDAILAR